MGLWSTFRARQWYFDKGWRSLDDVVEGGWDSLPRVQQIGIKYWEEFNEHKISRSEVEEIGRIVGDACQQVAAGTVFEICGGYISPYITFLILVTVEESPSLATSISSFRIPENMRRRICAWDWSKFWNNKGSSRIPLPSPQRHPKEKRTQNTPSDNADLLVQENMDTASTHSIKLWSYFYCQRTIHITLAFTDE